MLPGPGRAPVVPLGPCPPAARLVLRRLASTAARATYKDGGALLGTTVGTAAVFLSGSILAWPVADLAVGPLVVAFGLSAPPLLAADEAPCAAPGPALQQLGGSAASARSAGVTIVASGSNAGQEMERLATEAGRPSIYISLREATSPNDMYFAIMRGIYGADRLGYFGTLVHSMGIWWCVMFDILLRDSRDHNRPFNLSITLQHMRRGLRIVEGRRGPGDCRPLVILDHFDEALSAASARGRDTNAEILRSMLARVAAWCAAAAYDDRLADVAICGGPAFAQTSRWSRGPLQVERVSDGTAFQAYLRRWLP